VFGFTHTPHPYQNQLFSVWNDLKITALKIRRNFGQAIGGFRYGPMLLQCGWLAAFEIRGVDPSLFLFQKAILFNYFK
jgi:hypothetical protein